MSRYMEGQVLYLQKQIEEQSETAQDSGVELLKVRPILSFPGNIKNPFYRLSLPPVINIFSDHRNEVFIA